MTRCSVQPGDQILVKSYGSLSFVKNIDKNTGKFISKNLSGKYSPAILCVRNFLIMLNNLLKLLRKEQFKKQQKQLEMPLINTFSSRGH